MTKTLKADKRGRIRFTEYGFRFEINPTDPTMVTVYDRRASVWGPAAEIKLGTVNLRTAAFRLLNGTAGDETVIPTEPETDDTAGV